MNRPAMRFLTLSICAIALAMVPIATSVKAAPNSSREIEKDKKKIQKSAGTTDPKSSSPAWPPPIYDDPDRKNGGGNM